MVREAIKMTVLYKIIEYAKIRYERGEESPYSFDINNRDFEEFMEVEVPIYRRSIDIESSGITVRTIYGKVKIYLDGEFEGL